MATELTGYLTGLDIEYHDSAIYLNKDIRVRAASIKDVVSYSTRSKEIPSAIESETCRMARSCARDIQYCMCGLQEKRTYSVSL